MTLEWFLLYPTNCTQSVSTHCHSLDPWTYTLYSLHSFFPLSLKSIMFFIIYMPMTQLQKSATPHQISDLLLSMHKCLRDIKTWMTLNKLNLSDKTKVMIVSSGRKSRSLSSSFPDSMTVGSASVSMSDSVKNLCVTPDRENSHVKSGTLSRF